MAKFSKFSSVCYTCGLCESDFSKRLHFVLHIKAHDIINQHVCNTCGKIGKAHARFNKGGINLG